MSSTADDVRACIEQDPFVRECLARGIISHPKLARWLQKHRGIEGTEAAIVSAVRRAEPLREQDVFAVAREEAKNLQVHTQSGLALILLPNGPRVQDVVGKLADELGEVPRIFETRERVHVVVEQAQLDAALTALPADLEPEVQEDLAELYIIDRREGQEEPPGLMALVQTAIAAQDISIKAILGSYPDVRILVRDEDLDAAFRAVRDLIKGLT